MHATHTSHIKHVEIVTCVSFTWGLLIETPIASWKIRGCKAVYSRTCVSNQIIIGISRHDDRLLAGEIIRRVELTDPFILFRIRTSSPHASQQILTIILLWIKIFNSRTSISSPISIHKTLRFGQVPLSSNHLGYTSVASEKFSAFRFPLAFHCFNWSVWKHGLWY